jgi:uncharacterized protein (TIGR02611 family)
MPGREAACPRRGPVERVWENREVLPAIHRALGSARDPSASTGRHEGVETHVRAQPVSGGPGSNLCVVPPDARPHPIIQRLQARRERHLARSRFYRIVFAVAGFTVLAAGMAMLVLPGPGIPVMVIGLALLALEFAWAERMLERAVDRMERARRSAAEASRWQKVFGGLALATALAAVVVAVLYWDVPILPV